MSVAGRISRLSMRKAPGANTAADVPAGKAAASASRVPGTGGNAITVQGLPIMKPPYAVISAINLDRGDIQWQVPFGETPDNIETIRC